MNAASKINVEKALEGFAEAYLNCGCEWDEACDHAEFLFNRFKAEGNSEEQAADRLYLESLRYADM